jgi:lipopolysaccharide export system protein LptA
VRLLAAALLLLVTALLPAQEELRFSAQRSSSVFAEGQERIQLSGGARVESSEFEMTASEITISGPGQRYVEARGGVTVLDRENGFFLSSESVLIDREEDYLRARGGAYMEDRENEIIVKGELIQNWNARELTEISVNVRILGEDYTARGQFARYRRASDTLELSGTPEVFWRGDEYRADRITIDIENDEIDFVGDVQAVVRQSGEDEEEAGEPPVLEEPQSE